MADLRSAAVTGKQAHDRREGPSGAFPHHPDGRGRGAASAQARGCAGAQARGVLCRPHQSRVAVVYGGGEPVRRREPVVHRHHDGTHLHRDRTAHPVGQAQLAEHEPATMEVQDQRPPAGTGAGGTVDPHQNVPGRPGNGPVGYLGAGHDRPEDAVGHAVGRGVPGLHGDDLGLGLRADRALLPHQPRQQPHPAIDRRHFALHSRLADRPRGSSRATRRHCNGALAALAKNANSPRPGPPGTPGEREAWRLEGDRGG